MGQRGNFRTVAPLARVACAAAGCLILAQCSSGINSKLDPRLGVSASPRVIPPGEPVPKGGGVYRVGKPYTVAGKLYVPQENRHYRAEGLASWYGDDFRGRLTANGEIFDTASISAAHPTLPMPCYVRVTNLRNGRSIIARVNDRGPYAANRLIDVSRRTAQLLGFYNHGLTRVRVEYVGPAPLSGSDDRMLAATLRQDSPAPSPNIMVASAAPFVPQSPASMRSVGAAPPVPAERPYTLGDENAEEGPQLAAAAAAKRHELTANERIERAMGPAPAPSLASLPAASGGAVAVPTAVSAYAAPRGGAFMSGRGLY